MSIVQQGAINTTALVVPDLYVQIVSPTVALLNGVPTNIVGVVGTATWGPVGSPVPVGSMADYARTFGAIQNR
jgi:ABC-type phosphate transport system permease subunit